MRQVIGWLLLVAVALTALTLVNGLKLSLKTPSFNNQRHLELTNIQQLLATVGPHHLANYIISFHSTTQFTNEFKQLFVAQSQGVQLDDYLPQHSFVVQATALQVEKILKMSQVEQVVEYVPENKICKSVYDEEENDNLEWRLISVTLFKQYTPQNVEHEIKSLLKLENILVQSVMQTSGNVVIVQLKEQDVVNSAKVLSRHNSVQWIERRFHNEEEVITESKHAAWVVQSNTPNSYPVTDVGLTGKGQVIAVADSGLDVNNCYFYDPNEPVPYVNDSNAIIVPHSSKHRKIEMYYTFLDNYDAVEGHGTHVCGIAGAKFQIMNTTHLSNQQTTQFNGIAQDSKLVMFDVGCHTLGGCSCAPNTPAAACPCNRYKTKLCPYGQLSLPVDLRQDYFSKPYAAGARIHSNSIGSSIGQPYNDKSAAIDEFMYQNDDFLVVWSAGNSGREQGLATITGGFKQAKNHIVVGASVSAFESWAEKYTEDEDYDQLTKTRRGELFSMFNCACQSSSACNTIAELDTQAKCCALMGKKCDLSLPSAIQGTPKNPFKLVALDCCKACNAQEISNLSGLYDFKSLAVLSSVGPAMDGRIKPDVLAPGQYVKSANGHGDDLNWKCDASNPDHPAFHLIYKAGTSMATPVIAGAAALIRQYFVEGRYMVNGQNITLNPSGSLLKSMIIASARPLSGYTQSGSPFTDLLPSIRRYYEGYGLINLQNVIPIYSNVSLFVDDRRGIVPGNENVYRFNYEPKGKDLVISLVWTDPPASTFSSVALVNDLDLYVEYIDGTTNEKVKLWGNQVDASTSRPDRFNNVEKIIIPSTVQTSSILIKVIGENIPTTSQNYSLVVSGHHFEAHQIEESFRVAKSGETILPVPRTMIQLPIWAFTLIVAIAIFFALTTATGAVCWATSKLKQERLKKQQNHEMLERFVQSNYIWTDQ